MTEVPEHLLNRSRDRRAALGLGGGGDATHTSEMPADEPVPRTAEVAAETSTAAKAVAAAPAEAASPEPPSTYVQAALTRKKVPFWAMPMLAFLPVWAIIYVGGLSPADTGEQGPLELGAEIYTAQCANCHDTGVGRPLGDGEVLATFPDIAGQLEFVWQGSDGMGPAGTVYGDPDREGGAHATLTWSGSKMPAYEGILPEEELLAVVRYEREVLSGEEVPVDEIGDADQRFWPDGAPILDEAGQLVTPEGEALFDDEGRLTIDPDYG